MFKNKRYFYIVLIFVTILLGILSRKINGIPTFIGDTLYAVMVYYGMRFIFINLNKKTALILGLLFCYAIEFQQIYRAEWMLKIRNTPIGHYVLGQGFLWSDLGFYTIGIMIAFVMDYYWTKTPNTNSL